MTDFLAKKRFYAVLRYILGRLSNMRAPVLLLEYESLEWL